ncbi:MAG: helix-turn-helix transcriptional regulator [Candidatus Eisenbacteria bacterium]|uniref:Helix-turn-helix transcriptional regulator n=1 Tax=Eiseniibacteriota bacterium TaxID=2212470 RepID=A0A938BMM1_UNCEI|nr:helix-turn-helix transcriptional regulator [Candidatus Eisenbacteria bacterium]
MSKFRNSDLARLALFFGALAHPHRLRIFVRLAACGEAASCCRATPAGLRQCVGDLGAGLGLAASTVSHHIKELRRSGLMDVRRRGRRIECSLRPEAVRSLAAFAASVERQATAERTGGSSWKRETTGRRTRAAAAQAAPSRARAAAASRGRRGAGGSAG